MQGWEMKMDVVIGDERLPAWIYQTGTGNSFYIMINGKFEGSVNWMLCGWTMHTSSKRSILSSLDLTLVIEIIEENFPGRHPAWPRNRWLEKSNGNWWKRSPYVTRWIPALRTYPKLPKMRYW